MIETIDVGPRNFLEMSYYGDGRYILNKIVDAYKERKGKLPEVLFLNFLILDSFVNSSMAAKRQLRGHLYNTVTDFIMKDGAISICSNNLLERGEAYATTREFFELMKRGEFSVLEKEMVRIRISFRFHSKQSDEPLKNPDEVEAHDWDISELGDSGNVIDNTENKSEETPPEDKPDVD